LKSLLEDCIGKYNYILLDCPPLLGIVTTNALVASDRLYMPLTAEALPVKGLTMLDDVVSEVKKRINHKLELGGVFFTRFNNRKLNREVVSMIEQRYGDKVFKTKIRENIAIAEMPLTGEPIFEYAPKSNGAVDYMALTEEIIAREENR
jgi:chromosome partitioning protein